MMKRRVGASPSVHRWAVLAALCGAVAVVACARVSFTGRPAAWSPQRFAAATGEVSVDCESPAAELVCDVAYALGGGGAGASYSVVVEYERKGLRLVTAAKSIAVEGGVLRGRALVVRLRAKEAYEVRVVATPEDGQSGALSASTRFEAPGFPGGPLFDGSEPYAVSASGDATLELVFLGATLGNASADRWDGLVALDTEGFVVWGYETRIVCSFTQLRDHRFVVSSAPQDGTNAGSCDGMSAWERGPATAFANGTITSRLQVVTPRGDRGAELDVGCDGRPSNWTALSHRVTRVVDDASSVLAVSNYVRRYDAGVVVSKEPTKAVVLDAVVRWRPSDAQSLETVVDLGAVYNPANTRLDAPIAARMSETLTCDDAETSRSLDYWMHASGVSTAYDAKGSTLLVASLRDLNAVAVFDLASGARLWTLAAPLGGSGKVPSDLAFADADDAFYAPHSPRLVRGGTRLLVIDDGTSRPGCFAASDHVLARCFSRAVAYDLANGTASLAWEVELPLRRADDDDGLGALKVADGYNNDGGTVMTLADPGRVFIGFGKEQNRARDATDGDADYVLEYDAHDDALVFEMRVPRPHWKSGDFSLLPTVSIDGETRLGAAHSR